MTSYNSSEFSTRAIHGGLAPDPTFGAILTPIYQSTTFVQEAVGETTGYTYTRKGNPTCAALERNLAELESAAGAVCFSTGMAAITALFLGLLSSGEHVVVSDVVYGGTVRLLKQVLERFGVEATFVDTSTESNLRNALRDDTRLVFVETPANPTLKLTDIAGAAWSAHSVGALLVVDNTFLTPTLQTPFDYDADIVVYSTTKYIEGHNATVGGAVLTRDEELLEQIRFVQNSVGFSQSPLEAWLTLRGVKTLPIRMERHSRNALRVARYLEAHPRIRKVAYPFLPSFPQYRLAKRQQRAGGGMIAFEVEGGVEAGIDLMNSVKLCSLAENLGAVETLITHPASMTHAAVPLEDRSRAGISDGLVRLSVGLEDPDDIIADIERALSAKGGVQCAIAL